MIINLGFGFMFDIPAKSTTSFFIEVADVRQKHEKINLTQKQKTQKASFQCRNKGRMSAH